MSDAAERMNRRYGDQIRESLGAGRTPGVPLGMQAGRPVATARLAGVGRDEGAATIEVNRIVPDPEQPRRHFDEDSLDRLAESLKRRGQLQNIVVFWSEDLGSYVLVSGERRWRAARKASLETLRCRILDRRPDDADRLGLQLIENCVREDLDGISRGQAFRRLMDETGWSGAKLAAELNLSQPTVTNALKLLDLPETVREHVEAGRIGTAAACELTKLDGAETQAALAERIVDEKMTRDEVIDAVAAAKSTATGGKAKSKGGTRGGKAKGKRAARITKKRVLKVAGGKVTLERAKGIEDNEYLRLAAEAILGLRQTPADAQAVDEATTEDSSPDGEGQGRGVAA